MGALIKAAAEIRAELAEASHSPRCGSLRGTDAGFWRHRRAGQQPCPRCDIAHDTYERQWHQRNSATWQVRQWCRSVGLPVSRTGPLPGFYYDAYRAACAAAVLTPDDPDLPEEG